MDRKPQLHDWIYCDGIDYPVKLLGVVNNEDLCCVGIPLSFSSKRKIEKTSFDRVQSIIEQDSVISYLENEYRNVVGVALE